MSCVPPHFRNSTTTTSTTLEPSTTQYQNFKSHPSQLHQLKNTTVVTTTNGSSRNNNSNNSVNSVFSNAKGEIIVIEEICDLGLDNISNDFVEAEESNENLKPNSTNIKAYRTLVLVGRAMGGSGLKDGVRGLWGAGSGCGKQRVVLKSSLGEVNAVRRLLVDGAWDKKSWEGVVAWCLVGDGEEVRNEGRRVVFASSALMAEALAIWYALAWAFDRGWLSLEICSDCLVLVQGFQKANRVHPLVRIILSDIVHLACKFNYVVVSKVSRTEVRAAQALAKDVNYQV